jgi:hypothetical protein
MKRVLCITAALLVATPVAEAHTSENVLFTCEGELIKIKGNDGKDYYSIVESWRSPDDSPMPMDCDVDSKVLRQILTVCRVGDLCTASAKGESGNGNRYLIQKVFEVQRQPASRVKELKRDFKTQ